MRSTVNNNGEVPLPGIALGFRTGAENARRTINNWIITKLDRFSKEARRHKENQRIIEELYKR